MPTSSGVGSCSEPRGYTRDTARKDADWLAASQALTEELQRGSLQGKCTDSAMARSAECFLLTCVALNGAGLPGRVCQLHARIHIWGAVYAVKRLACGSSRAAVARLCQRAPAHGRQCQPRRQGGHQEPLGCSGAAKWAWHGRTRLLPCVSPMRECAFPPLPSRPAGKPCQNKREAGAASSSFGPAPGRQRVTLQPSPGPRAPPVARP